MMKGTHQVFAAACLAGAAHATNPLIELGTPSISILQYSFNTVVDDGAEDGDCDYTLTMSFKHDQTFPYGGDEECQVDVEADDGKNYFDTRWYYQRFDYATRLATGFDHVSIDWNACGHPGFAFQTPHYDFHVYTVSPEFRATNMKCDKIFGTGVCKEESAQTGTGQGYYVIGKVASTNQLDNLPAGHTWNMRSAVEYMGIHSENPLELHNPDEWTEPVLYFTSFGGSICAFEPMFPFSYVSGDEYKFHEETVEYEVKTLKTLPTYYSAEFKPETGFTTVVYKGKSALCAADFHEARINGEPGTGTPTEPTSAGFRRAASMALTMAVVFLASVMV